MIYHLACFLAFATGMRVTHRWSKTPEIDYRHEEVEDIVLSLYTGMRTSTSYVSVVGSTKGIGASKLSDRDIWAKVHALRAARIAADYLGGGKEPLGQADADDLIQDADTILGDLRGLLP
jgi:hypothetical protein